MDMCDGCGDDRQSEGDETMNKKALLIGLTLYSAGLTTLALMILG
jgi:hypothetical protein